jgi:hypothetical protein
MPHKDFLYFRKLKESLVKKVKEKYPEANTDISTWKGKEILLFQIDLENTVKGRISEKWFYTHLKSDTDRLPRVDILDLLSRYVGFEDWQSFKNSQSISVGSNRRWVVGIGAIVLLLVAGYIFVSVFHASKYSISVVDAYTNIPLTKDQLLVIQLFEDQSPLEIPMDKAGNYVLFKTGEELTFVINAPYYHSDTVVRKPTRSNRQEVIRLMPNDYALMIDYFANTETNDWMQRRKELSDIISEKARIIQVDKDNQMALELYSKNSFINKLTIPSKSLQNIEILDIRFEAGQISQLRFRQKKGGNDE